VFYKFIKVLEYEGTDPGQDAAAQGKAKMAGVVAKEARGTVYTRK
jgi:hypothetical protein